MTEQSQTEQMLRMMGLDTVMPWAVEQILNGATAQQIELALYRDDNPGGQAFKARFPAIAERERISRETGRYLAPLTPGDYIRWEQRAEQLERFNGLPPGFLTSKEAQTKMLTEDVSLDELSWRVEQGFVRASQAGQAVKDRYRDWFGADGDAALAAQFLDPDLAQPILERRMETAEVGGAGWRYGIGVGKSTAERLVDIGVNAERAVSGFADLDRMRSLFSETLAEQANDYSIEGEGVGAVFGTEGGAAEKLSRRLDERVASTAAAGTGGTGKDLGAAS